MQYENPYRNRRIAALILVVILVGGGIVLALRHANNSSPTNSSQSQNTKAPSYSGTDQLLSLGVSDEALSDMEFAFYRYLKTTPAGTGQKVTIANPSHAHATDSSGNITDTYRFEATITGTVYGAALQTTPLSTAAQLTLTDEGGNTVFSSGLVDVNTSNPPL